MDKGGRNVSTEVNLSQWSTDGYIVNSGSGLTIHRPNTLMHSHLAEAVGQPAQQSYDCVTSDNAGQQDWRASRRAVYRVNVGVTQQPEMPG